MPCYLSQVSSQNVPVDRLILPRNLEASNRILIAGAGGGFDVYAGLPIYHRLKSLGKEVLLANLSFADLRSTDAEEVAPSLFQVLPDTQVEDQYFPERALSQLVGQPIFAFENVGAKPLREGYQYLAERFQLDAIVLIDGGTDILLRGNESRLGTPVEDAASLRAVNDIEVPTKMVACIGLGVDTFHGVNHANWLENVAALTKEGAFFGAQSVLPPMPEAQFYLDAVRHADMAFPGRPSIVNGSIASAIEGEFGNYHRYRRTRDSELFISPLMSLLWMFDLTSVARHNLYLSLLRNTETTQDVARDIEGFHATVPYRDPGEIPY